MTDTTDEARRALGIPPEARLMRLPGLRPTQSNAAEGKGEAGLAALALAALVQGPLRENPAAFVELELPAQVSDAGVTRARWSELAPVAQLAGPGLSEARTMGETFVSGGVWYLDGRAGAKTYLPSTGGRPGVVLTVGADGIGVELVEEEGPVLAAEWPTLAPLEVPRPSLATLLGDSGQEAGCAPWLEREFTRLVDTNAPLAVVSAVGLVPRPSDFDRLPEAG